ncbi:hypothetical protein KUA24_78 [Vibrio phage HNL01]|nr:hypothetical protein KUA24_78 [Vibrio phage HNL01]
MSNNFYKGVDLVKEERNGKDVFILVIKLNDMVENRVVLKPDQLEHIISRYRITSK